MIHKAFSGDPFAKHQDKVPLCWLSPDTADWAGAKVMRSDWEHVTCPSCLELKTMSPGRMETLKTESPPPC